MSQQEYFDRTFITSTEVCQTLGVNRSTVLLAVRSGKLPDPITIRRADGGVHIALWPRVDIASALADWAVALNSRKAA